MNQPAPRELIREPLAPPSHIAYAHKLGRGLLTFEQIEQLVLAINPAYVATKRGGMSYLSQHQARAEMNRIFGYGNWDVIEGEPTLLYEEMKENNGKKYIACYRASVTINVRDLWGMPVATVTGSHAEANANLPDRSEAHAMALTSVFSYALRRALINFGDRFGLGLYNGGSQAPHGQYTQQLFPGQMFRFVNPNAPTQQVDVAPAITHETIVAEPAVGDDTSWQPTPAPTQQAPQQYRQDAERASQIADGQAGIPPQQPQAPQQQLTQQGGMEEFRQAQETLQQGRQEYRQQHQQAPQNQQPQFNPNLLAQAQGAFRVDNQGGQ